MAKDKRSFIAYLDWGSTFDELDDNEAGQLIKLVFDYVRDKNPEPKDKLIRVAFEHIKQDLKRDLRKWEGYIEKQKANGYLGGRPKKEETQKTQAFFEKPKKADNVNVFVNDNVNVNDNVIKRERAFAPPTKEELILEFSKKLDDFTAMGEAEKFLNHYESNGWKVNKNKMKSWKSSVAGWITRMPNFNYGSHKQTSKSTGAEQLLDSLKADIAAGAGNYQG